MIYEVYLDGKNLYYPGDSINALISTTLERKLNQAGTFKIVVPSTNPCFDSFKQRQSEVKVLKDGTEIWNGEVLNIGGNMKNQKSVYIVGELSYLNASSQPQKQYKHITPAEMLSILLQEHNTRVETRKQFTLGMVTVNKEYYNFTTNYEKTLDYIRAEMCDRLNGYLRIRKVNEVRYLDLVKLEDYGKRCTQAIEFGENLLDFTSDITADEIVTVVRPLGGKLETSEIEGMDSYLTIESVNDGKDYLENTDAINSGMGKIWETVHFNVLTDASAVKTAGENYLRDRQFAKMNITATAIDLSMLHTDIECFEMGDSVNILATPFGMDKWSYIMEKKVDLLNPSVKHNVTIGETVKKTYTQQITSIQEELKKNVPQQSVFLELAKKNASEIIKFASEGNVHTVYNEQGKPIEICIMDTDDINTARRIWRWSMGGFGYSKTGYNGDFEYAITMDGAFVADFITVGVLNAALIKAGILSDEAGLNFWDMITGEFSMSSSAKVGDSTVASVKNVDDAKTDAINSANDSTDGKLKSYSTTTEMNSAIQRNAEEMTFSFDKKIDETKVYALEAASDAENNANASTEEKLKLYTTTTEMNSLISQSAESVKSEMNKSINTLQQQIDGAIETFTGSEVPTVLNYPANEWTTNETKDVHIGDLYVVNADGGDSAGFYYRFEKSGSVYQWTLLKDNEVTKALQDAKEANEKAQAVADDLAENYSTTKQMNSSIEQKAEGIKSDVNAQIQETRQYADGVAESAKDNANANTVELLKSYSTTAQMNTVINQKADSITQEVNKKVSETKVYADNSATTAKDEAIANTTEQLKSYTTTAEMNTLIAQSASDVKIEVNQSITNLQKQIDGAIETHSGSEVPTLENAPASEWTTDEIKATHVGDLYVVSSDGEDYAGFYYRFEKSGSVYQWTLLKDNEVTKALQDAKEANERAEEIAKDLEENYSTTEQMTAAIDVSTKEIGLKVSQKVGIDEIIAKINISPETILIAAKMIDIDGVLDVEKLNALALIAGSVAAENITGTTISGKKFIAEGTVTKYASDYTQNDVDRANRISLGLEIPTLEDLEKLDTNADGIIDVFDIIRINNMLKGNVEKYEIPVTVTIDPFSSQNAIKTDGVAIGKNGGWFANSTHESINLNTVNIMQAGTGSRAGVSGTFTTADGKTVTVVSGIIVGIG